MLNTCRLGNLNHDPTLSKTAFDHGAYGAVISLPYTVKETIKGFSLVMFNKLANYQTVLYDYYKARSSYPNYAIRFNACSYCQCLCWHFRTFIFK